MDVVIQLRNSGSGTRLIRIRPRPSELPLHGLILVLFTGSRYRQGEANQRYECSAEVKSTAPLRVEASRCCA